MGYLGIDLGTTNSTCSIYNDKTDSIDIVKIDGIDEVLPSVVSYGFEDGVVVGSEAKSGAIIYPESTIVSIKRMMGTKEKIIINNIEKSPEEISSEILKKLKLQAQKQSNEIFDEVVITHPAYFNDRQIYATKEAGLLAGFKEVYLLSEPLSAAIEYGYKQGYAQTLLVYDLGGGTFDACILKVSIDENGEEKFEELADVGDMNLGGDDFDAELINFMIEKFKEQNGIDLTGLDEISTKTSIQKLKQEAEQVKKKLSSTNKAIIKINPLIIVEGVPKNLSTEITREGFEAIIRKYIERSREILQEALKRANKKPDEISKVILVGGSTLIPIVKRMVAGFIKEPYRATDPAKSVAMGASIYNYLIHLPKSNVNVLQITRQIFGTQALVDISSMKRELIPIIPLGSPIPSTFSDNKFKGLNGAKSVDVDVYQWEQGKEDEKKYIGTAILGDLTEKSQIEITYAINKDNLFEVHLKDVNTGKVKITKFDRSKFIEKPKKSDVQMTSREVNITFIIDTTGSMENYINGVKDRAIEFSKIVSQKGIKFNLGLIGFGDLYEKEKPSVYSFTNNVEKFKKQVNNIPRTYGGDIPESSLDALETGVKLLESSTLAEDSQNIFILITDAPPHIPTKSGKTIDNITTMLKTRDITMYVVARRDRESIDAFNPLTTSNGKYYDLRDEFYDILDSIAKSITELVRL